MNAAMDSGSVTHTVAEDGTIPSGYSYDAFGEPDPTNTDDRFLFAGEQYDEKARQVEAQFQPGDPDPGLYYLRARYYDPEIGRFLTRDPFPGAASLPSSQNRYAYAFNNPVNYVDPYGLFGFGDIKKAVGGAIEEVGGAIVDTVGSNAFTAASCGAAALNPIAIGACGVSSLLNDNTRPYVLNGVQWLDLVPVGVVLGPGTIAGAVLDAAAFLAGEYQIVVNGCLSTSQKWALTGNNLLNLVVGQVGNVVEGVPGFQWVAVPVTTFELSSFEASQVALDCKVAYSSGSGSSGKE